MWTCPDCGYENNTGVRTCSTCGYNQPVRITLTDEKGGVVLTAGIETPISQRSLVKSAHADKKYVSNPQCRLIPVSEASGWALSHVSTARNDTFLNGVALTEALSPLNEGDVISIKGKMPLKVSFIFGES